MNLYYICQAEDDERSLDLHVKADSIEKALFYWAEYFDLEHAETEQARVFQLNLNAPEGALSWHTKDCWELTEHLL